MYDKKRTFILLLYAENSERPLKNKCGNKIGDQESDWNFKNGVVQFYATL